MLPILNVAVLHTWASLHLTQVCNVSHGSLAIHILGWQQPPRLRTMVRSARCCTVAGLHCIFCCMHQ